MTQEKEEIIESIDENQKFHDKLHEKLKKFCKNLF